MILNRECREGDMTQKGHVEDVQTQEAALCRGESTAMPNRCLPTLHGKGPE